MYYVYMKMKNIYTPKKTLQKYVKKYIYTKENFTEICEKYIYTKENFTEIYEKMQTKTRHQNQSTNQDKNKHKP